MQAAPLPAIDLLHPLSTFFATDPPPDLEAFELAGCELPEPYRELLVHDRDMTSTLERFWGEPLALRQLARRRSGDVLLRRVALVGASSGRVAELGAIKIYLHAFANAPRREILEGRRPLGSILTRYEVAYRSAPLAFFRLRPDAEMQQLLSPGDDAALYGRQNILRAPNGQPLADVVEILPVLREGAPG